MSGRRYQLLAYVVTIIVGALVGVGLASRQQASFSAATSVEVSSDRKVLAPWELGPQEAASDVTAYLSGEIAYLTSAPQKQKVSDNCSGRTAELQASQVGASNVVTVRAQAADEATAKAVLDCTVRTYQRERQKILSDYLASETTSAQTRLTQLSQQKDSAAQQESARLQQRLSDLTAMGSRTNSVVQQRTPATSTPSSGASSTWLWPLIGATIGFLVCAAAHFASQMWNDLRRTGFLGGEDPRVE